MANPTQTAPDALDPAEAEAAFRSIERRLVKIGPGAALDATIDVDAAVRTALAAAAILGEPEVRGRILALAASGAIDQTEIDDLPVAARAAWHADRKLQSVLAARPEPVVPESLLEEAASRRTRMLEILEQSLAADKPDVARQLAVLRNGQGYLDVANDLIALAAMFDVHRNALAASSAGVLPTDAKTARKTAEQLLVLVGGAGSAEREVWKRHRARTFALLLKVYEDVRRTGRFLFSGEGADEKFPPLVPGAPASGAPASSAPASSVPTSSVPASGALDEGG